MNNYLEDGLRATFNRRQLLRTGLFGSAILAGGSVLGSLSGCSPPQHPDINSFALRADDLAFFSALYPLVLAGTISEQAALRTQQLSIATESLNRYMSRLSPELQKQMLQLLDLVNNGLTRGLLTGVWVPWSEASEGQIEQFLQRWKKSSLQLLRMGYSLLMQLMAMAWYMTEPSWPAVGYPGPPFRQQLITAPNRF